MKASLAPFALPGPKHVLAKIGAPILASIQIIALHEKLAWH